MRKKGKPFIFETAWSRDASCQMVIQKAWDTTWDGNPSYQLCRKIQKIREELIKWKKEVFGMSNLRIKGLLEELNKLQREVPSEITAKAEANIQHELDEWILREEMLWKQRSRELKLKEGDRNSRFFHVSTLVRRRRNHIEAIKSDQGDWLREWSEISQDFNTNFQDLYSEESATFPEDLDGLVQNCITD